MSDGEASEAGISCERKKKEQQDVGRGSRLRCGELSAEEPLPQVTCRVSDRGSARPIVSEICKLSLLFLTVVFFH